VAPAVLPDVDARRQPVNKRRHQLGGKLQLRRRYGAGFQATGKVRMSTVVFVLHAPSYCTIPPTGLEQFLPTHPSHDQLKLGAIFVELLECKANGRYVPL